MVHANDIATFLGESLIGENIEINSVGTMQNFGKNSVVFAKFLNAEFIEMANSAHEILVIASKAYDKTMLHCSFIIAENPRLSYLRIVKRFFYAVRQPAIHKTAIVGDTVVMGKDISIGAYSVIEGPITIGDNTIIGNHVSITGTVSIGCNCWIKSGAVIGEEGFGFEPNENGILEHFPHIGKIVIGNNVFFGANSTIERAALDTTTISDGVAVDDLTQISHNVFIGKNTTIASGAVLCGGVVIGENCSIAPNSCVRQKLTVGNHVTIGLGAVVVKNIPDEKIYVGNPAAEIVKTSSTT